MQMTQDKPQRVTVKIRLSALAYRALRDFAEDASLSKSAFLELTLRNMEKERVTDVKS